jgi:hypothetical protein
MGIVNPPEVHPGILRALYRLCVGRGSDFTATLGEFVALLAPAAVVHEGTDPQRSARLSVKAAQDIGMLAVLDGNGAGYRLAMTPPPNDGAPVAAEASFIRELRRLIMAPENNTDLFGEEDRTEDPAEREQDETLSADRAREFTRIQAWLLMQDPRSPSLTFSHDDARRNIQRLQDRYAGRDLVVNSNRWVNFRRWSLFLGFSRQDHLAGSPNAGTVPDATRAVRDEIVALRDGTDEFPLVELRDRIAQRLPVLDGGAYREEVARHVGHAEDPRIASPTLALALLRCAGAGVFELATLADFSGGTLTVGERSYTHVRLGAV